MDQRNGPPTPARLRHREVLTEQFAAVEALIDEARARHDLRDVTRRSERSWRDEATKRLRIINSIARQYPGPALAAEVRKLEDGIVAGQALLADVLKALPEATGHERPRKHKDGVCPRCGTRQRVSREGTVWMHDFESRRCPGVGLRPIDKEFVPRDGVVPKAFRKQTKGRIKAGLSSQAQKAAGGVLNVTDRSHSGTQVRSIVRGGLPGRDRRG